jgi:hypothetical protein
MKLILQALAVTLLAYLLPLAVLILGSAGLLTKTQRTFDPSLPIRDASVLACCLDEGRD